MPLDNSFSKFLEEKSLMRSASLEKLRGTRIAIDAHNWMKVLTPKINEPYQAVMGGVPLTMGKAISTELDRFKKANITPIFVFNGLPMILTQSPQQLVQNPFLLEIYEKREQAWAAYHDGKLGCRQMFESAGSTITSSEFQHNLIRILRENRVEFFKAPYMAWAQMAYWCQNKERCVHQIQGPNELIMFEHVEVLILEFHFPNDSNSQPEFDYIIKSEIKAALMQHAQPSDGLTSPEELTDSQFLDCCLLTGLKGQIKHPKHFNLVHFVKIAQTLQRFGNACDFIMSKPPVGEGGPTNQQLAKNHMRIRAVIRHSVVFTLDGQCQPMTHSAARESKTEEERVPCNLSDLWGQRLPNILYFFLSIGAIQTQVLINVVQNQMIETIPQMDTEDYRLLLQRILPLRTQIAYQLIHQLGERDEKYFIRGPMTCWRWFHNTQATIPQPPPIKLDEWDIAHHDICKARKPASGGGEAKLDFLFVVKHFSKNAIKDKTYNSFEEVICAIHLKALDLLGYFTHATVVQGTEEPASGLSMFSEALLKTNAPQFSEYAVLLIELFRTKALTRNHFVYMRPDPSSAESKSEDPWKEPASRNKMHFPALKLPPVYMQAQKDAKAAYEYCCLLISRIWSLLPMELRNLPWTSDVSKDLLAFNTIVKAFHKTLRNLIEVVAAVLFLECRTSINPYHYHELPQTLPFGQESNTAMGIVIDYIMRSHEDFGKGAECNTRAKRIAHLQEKFPCCSNLEGDLEKGFQFWLTVLVIYNELKREPQTVSSGLDEIFHYGNEMLRIKLNRVIDLGSNKSEDDDYKEDE
ncbi:viral life cyclerelated protein [Diplonema papillatum]|nr:viral life cyclerelated protein [Diplonema papillatum]